MSIKCVLSLFYIKVYYMSKGHCYFKVINEIILRYSQM